MHMFQTGGSVALIILGFGLLIAIHELGHFLAARWAGIRVDAFAVGMGPVLVAWRKGIGFRTRSTDRAVAALHGKTAIELTDAELAEHGIGETEYSLRWLPIGGFVKMVGQEDLKPSAVSITPRSYGRCSIGRRMIVVSAGVIANIILAMALFVIAFMVGVRVEAPVIGMASPGSPAALAVGESAAARATLDGSERISDAANGLAASPSASPASMEVVGLQGGDRVLSIDGRATRAFADLLIAAAMSKPGDRLHLIVERPGIEQPLHFYVAPRHDPAMGIRSVGVAPAAGNRLSEAREFVGTVEALLARTGLRAAGVVPGMSLVEVAGTPVVAWQQADALFVDGTPVEMVWQDDEGGRVTTELAPSATLLMAVPDAEGVVKEIADGLLGLVPLVKIIGIPDESPNHGLFEVGDVILQVDGVNGPRGSTIREIVSARPRQSVPITVRRGGVNGEIVELQASISRLGLIGVMLGVAEETTELAEPVDEILDATGAVVATPFATLQVRPRSAIVAVNGEPVSNWFELRHGLLAATQDLVTADGAARAGATVRLRIAPPKGVESDRSGQANDRPVASMELDVSLSADEVAALHAAPWRSGIDAVVFDPLATTLTANGNPLRAIAMGFSETHQLVLLTYLTIDRLFRRSVPVDQLRGPVGIVHLGTRVVDRGWTYLVFFLAMISVNLAVLNFLPLPIVDGGLFLFLVYEKIRGEPPPVAFQNLATIVGLLLIGTLFVVTFYNDIARLISGSI